MSSRSSTRDTSRRSVGGARAMKGGDGRGANLRGIDGEKHGVVFEDPRDKQDRRRVNIETSIPDSGCRRRVDRRSDRLHMGVWWMKRNYCVDLTRPARKAGNAAVNTAVNGSTAAAPKPSGKTFSRNDER